jgi:sec-independent protein translocase protein TatA
MEGRLGLTEILFIVAIALLLFGPSKFASLGKGLGEGIRNFKSAMKDGEEKKPENSAEKKS